MSRTRLSLAVLVVVALALAVYGLTGPPPDPRPAQTPGSTVAPSTTGPTPTRDPGDEDPAEVTLGLGGAIGETLWTPEEEAMRVLTDALGPPDVTREVPACRGDDQPARLRRWGDLLLSIRLEPLDLSETLGDAVPVEPPYVEGWTVLGPSPRVLTREGLQVGSTVGEMRGLYPEIVVLEESADEAVWEVFLGDFSNLTVTTTGPDDDATVASMVSGAICDDADALTR